MTTIYIGLIALAILAFCSGNTLIFVLAVLGLCIGD